MSEKNMDNKTLRNRRKAEVSFHPEKPMTSRERTRRAVCFDTPDRIPLHPDVTACAWRKLGIPLEKYLAGLPLDVPLLRCNPEGGRKAGQWVDAWGCVWENARDGEYGTSTGHPLENWDDFPAYRFPAPKPLSLQSAAPTKNKSAADSYYTIASGSGEYGVLWYRMQFLRGFENVMMDIAVNPDQLRMLRDGVLQSRMSYLGEVLKRDVDAIHFGDCWGMQHSLMIRPGEWRRCFKNAYKQLFDRVHASGKKVVFQSDGYTLDILGDLIEIGADVLRISVGMMDIRKIAEIVRGRACLWTDPCRQHILPFGAPSEVKKHVREIIEAVMISEGGLIGGLYIDGDMPLDNVKAAMEAYMEYGRL